MARSEVRAALRDGALLVLVIVVLLFATVVMAWAAAGAVVATLVREAGLGFKQNLSPSRDRKALAMLLTPVIAGFACFYADKFAWGLFAAMFLAGTVPTGPNEERLTKLWPDLTILAEVGDGDW